MANVYRQAGASSARPRSAFEPDTGTTGVPPPGTGAGRRAGYPRQSGLPSDQGDARARGAGHDLGSGACGGIPGNRRCRGRTGRVQGNLHLSL